MEAVVWDLRWKIALDLPVDHGGWHPTSLTRFRARLLLHRMERVALERTLVLAGELGLLDAPAEQIIDSTPMLGAAATQDTVRLVRHAVRKLLDAVAAVDEPAAGMLDRALEFDYARPSEKPDCRWREKAERERMLSRVAVDAERALRGVQGADGLLSDERVADAHALLRELIGQDFDLDEDGVPRLHQGTRANRIISTVDREMRHGRKSSHQRFDGYKLSAAATNTPEPLITAVDVAAAGDQDGPQAKHLIDAQPAERRPRRVLGDTAYGIGPVRAELADRDVEVLAPVPRHRSSRAGWPSATFTSISRRDRDLPGPTDRTGPHRALRPAPRELCQGRLRHLPRARSLRCARPRTAIDPHRARRRAHDRRAPSAPGSGHRRAPAPHPPADRTAPGPAHPPLRRAQEPLHRTRQSPTTGRLGRRPGQPQPHRPPPSNPKRLTTPPAPRPPLPHPPNHAAQRHRRRTARPTSSGVF